MKIKLTIGVHILEYVTSYHVVWQKQSTGGLKMTKFVIQIVNKKPTLGIP